jgi:hypothetical protein
MKPDWSIAILSFSRIIGTAFIVVSYDMRIDSPWLSVGLNFLASWCFVWAELYARKLRA